MSKAVLRAGSEDEFWTSERCFIRERINHVSIPGFSLADSRVEPGVTTEWHRLTVDEWYYIVEGEGLMEVGDADACRVGPGDTVTIPAGIRQRITNTGEIDLRLQCVCQPRFTPESYESLETTEPTAGAWRRS